MLSYKFILQSAKDKNGNHTIMIMATYKRNRKYFSIGQSVKTEHWNPQTCKVNSKDKAYVYKNSIISAYDNIAKDTILKCLVNKKTLSLNVFIEALKNNASEELSEFALDLHDSKALSIRKATLINYEHQLNKLTAFKKNINILDVDIKFINDYAYWLKETRKNNESTVSKSLTYLRMLLNEAVKAGIINKSPFINFRIKAIATRDESLSIAQVLELEKLRKKREKLTQNESDTLKAFLFSCYTGISFGDLSVLLTKDVKTIELEEKEYFYITNERLKTTTPYTVPLTNKALDLINLNAIPKAPLFKMFVNQVTNRHLKRIAKKAGIIVNHMSFHLARHTYGTINLNAGADQKAIMTAMGHKSVKVNDIYSRVQLEFLVKELIDKKK